MSGHSSNLVNGNLIRQLINYLVDGDASMANLKWNQIFEEEFEGGKIVMKLWQNKYSKKNSRAAVMQTQILLEAFSNLFKEQFDLGEIFPFL